MGTSVNIILSGPESSGKSSAGEWLSMQTGMPYTPEYARLFLEKHGPAYTKDTLDRLWREHLVFQQKKRAQGKNNLLDTDLLNYQVWYEEVFKEVPESLLKKIEEEQAHRYLLFYPDIPWQADPLRENPHDRERLFSRYLTLIKEKNRSFEIVTGSLSNRYLLALKGVKKLLNPA